MDHDGKKEREYWQETAASEVARVFFGHSYMMEALGSLLPAVIDLSKVQKILDVGCGNGEWARRLAKEQPHIHIIGMDTSLQLVQEAVKRAEDEGIHSLSFYQFGTAQELNFPNEHFDVVHIHSLASFISTAMWSKILDEMIRLLKIGGWLNIVDYEHGTTSSAAFNKLAAMGMAGVRALGGSISPSSPTRGAAARLYGFLVDVGLIDVTYSVHALDYGVNSHPGTRAFLNDFIVDMTNFRPFLLQLELLDGETFDRLLEQTRRDFFQSDSCGYAYLISAVGRKEP